jgi:periplasmic protein TonB
VSIASKGRAFPLAAPMVALSIALHGAAWASIAHMRQAPRHERIELEVVRSRPRPPAPPPPAAEPVRPPPVVRRTALARPVRRPEPALPPPLASAPEAPPPVNAPKALPRIGVSLGSTVAAGGFAVGVGNTLQGRPEEKAADPASVRPYAGAVPEERLSARPRVLELPQIAYPPDARRAGVEGRVVLRLNIDARGQVVGVRVVEAPSPSLAAAAKEGARRFRFTPALLDGAPVETEIRFIYTFFLE